ncbi:MAG: TPM domain-containing protein [Luteolibacter sp.]
MKTFLTNEEEQAVVEEIRKLETRTSGEMRVAITDKWIFLPERHAWKRFHQLGMSRTVARNGALIVVIRRRRRFVVLGDVGISAVVGPGYWEMIANVMSRHLRDGERLAAMLAGVRLLGETMATHWPPEETNTDELPNEIARG